MICMGNLGQVFSRENTPEGCTETNKSNFFPYKQVIIIGRNGDHEWFRITNAFILCDLVWKVQKSHAANREGSFKVRLFFSSISIRNGSSYTDQDKFVYLMEFHWKEVSVYLVKKGYKDCQLDKLLAFLVTLYYVVINQSINQTIIKKAWDRRTNILYKQMTKLYGYIIY